MEFQATVIICTHNPRADYLRRALDGLGCQTLPKEIWELLLVDNASTTPLAQTWNLAWHPNSRHIREEELGLTPARLRGIRESKADLLIFVDDDNVLAPDFLSVAISTAESFPQIGAFGASSKGEFEVEPATSLKPYIPSLSVMELDRDHWSNAYDLSLAIPCGASLCVRRSVARDYLQKVDSNPKRRILDRKGRDLGCSGDLDLALCAVDLGMGTGRFRALRMTHLIPKERLSHDYIVKLSAGSTAGLIILNSLRGKHDTTIDKSPLRMVRLAWRLLNSPPLERRLILASRRARISALRLLADSR